MKDETKMSDELNDQDEFTDQEKISILEKQLMIQAGQLSEQKYRKEVLGMILFAIFLIGETRAAH